MTSMCSRLATPPPFKQAEWSVDASAITATYRYSDNGYTGYQFRINKGEWQDSASWTELTDPGTYNIQIRPIILDLVHGSQSDTKQVVVS